MLVHLGFGSPDSVEENKPGVFHISSLAGESLCMKICHENLLLNFRCHKYRFSLSHPQQLKLSIFFCNFFSFREIRTCSLPGNSFGIFLLAILYGSYFIGHV